MRFLFSDKCCLIDWDFKIRGAIQFFERKMLEKSAAYLFKFTSCIHFCNNDFRVSKVFFQEETVLV